MNLGHVTFGDQPSLGYRLKETEKILSMYTNVLSDLPSMLSKKYRRRVEEGQSGEEMSQM